MRKKAKYLPPLLFQVKTPYKKGENIDFGKQKYDQVRWNKLGGMQKKLKYYKFLRRKKEKEKGPPWTDKLVASGTPHTNFHFIVDREKNTLSFSPI